MPNIHQPPGQLAEISLQDGQHSKQPIAQTLHQKAHTGLIPKVLEGQMSAMPLNSLAHNQFSATVQSTLHPRTQLQQYSCNHVLPPAAAQSLVPKLPPQNPLVRPQIQVSKSSSLDQHLQPSLPHSGQLATANLIRNNLMVLPNAVMQSAPLPTPLSDSGFQVQISFTNLNSLC